MNESSNMTENAQETQRWIVCPWYATGSSWQGTRRYVWQALPAPSGARADFWGTTAIFATREEAERAAEKRTQDNEPF